MVTPKTIHLRHMGTPTFEEREAGGTITPGHLVGLNSSNKYVVHPTAGGRHEREFAIENAYLGKSIDDNYVNTDRVFTVIAQPGDIIYGWLAPGENADVGSHLSSNGDGTLQVISGSETSVGVALEAVNLSASGSAKGRVKVRII